MSIAGFIVASLLSAFIIVAAMVCTRSRDVDPRPSATLRNRGGVTATARNPSNVTPHPGRKPRRQ